MIPTWLANALDISGDVNEYQGTRHISRLDALAIVLPQICVSCNSGWMNDLELRVRPILEPLLLGARRGDSRVIDPSQQATLATWAVKTSLLLAARKFRRQRHVRLVK